MTLPFFQVFDFDPGSSIKLLSSKIAKNVSLEYGAIFSRQSCHQLWQFKRYWLKQLGQAHRTNICESDNLKLF